MTVLTSLRGWRRARARSIRRLRRLRRADAVVVSYPKSGRTWLRAMLSHLYHQRYDMPDNELIDCENFNKLEPRIPAILFTHDGMNERWNRSTSTALQALAPKRIVFLVRDPRDVVVSQYFQLTKRETEAAGTDLRAADGSTKSLGTFVAGAELDRIIAFMNRWAKTLPQLPRTMQLTYEAIKSQPEASLAAVTTFLGETFTAEEIEAAVAFARFDSLKAKERDGFFRSYRLQAGSADDAESFKVRRGKVRGYLDYLTRSQADDLDSRVNAGLADLYPYRTSPEPAQHGHAASRA